MQLRFASLVVINLRRDLHLKFDTSEHFSCNWRSPAQ
jgi:hypothetical protein